MKNMEKYGFSLGFPLEKCAVAVVNAGTLSESNLAPRPLHALIAIVILIIAERGYATTLVRA